jgi:TolB-like protein/DNA-binding winged helix-turn-helix (wHTH) protein/Tfp pilus assembly protein PilF
MPEGKHFFEFGPFRLDPAERLLLRNNQTIPLAPKAFDTLLLLVENSGHLLTKDELMKRLWPETFVEEVNLAQNISAIRRALDTKNGGAHYIETVAKGGYRFVAETRKVVLEPSPLGAVEVMERPDALPAGERTLWRLISVLALGGVAALLIWFAAGKLRGRIFAKSRTVEIRSIAVLPLENLSRDPGQDYFSDGITEALTTDLAQIGALRVISRTSAMHFKGSRETLPDIGRQLNVEAIVEGSVMRSGDRVRITAQLIDAHSDQHLWARTYERDLKDILGMQDEVARDIATEIRIKLTPQEQSRLTAERRTNPRAYDAYLRGRYLWSQRNAEATAKAEGYFREAVREDPDFAPAYSGLSDCYWVGWGAKVDLPLAEQYARKALSLQQDLAEGHASLGIVRHMEYQSADAEQELRRALELNPNYAMAHHFYSGYLLGRGLLAEALAENDRARQLDPFSLPINTMRGLILTNLRQYDQAVDQVKRTAEIFPQSPFLHIWLARIYWLQGRAVEAIAEDREAETLAYAAPQARNQEEVAKVYEKSGLRAARLKSAQLMERNYKDNHEAVPVAFRYGTLEDGPKVLQWLEEAFRIHDGNFPLQLKTAPEFDFLRADPRFQDLLRRAGLPQ